MINDRLLLPLAVLAVLGAARLTSAVGQEVPRLRVVGPPTVVIDRAAPFCGGPATPDAPARAWRDAAGVVHLVAADTANRALTGPDPRALSPDCSSRFSGRGDADPGALDDQVWLAATWTRDGRTVHALGHAEYHGHRHPGRCPDGAYRPCWRNAVVALRSTDGGRSFSRAGPDPAVAVLQLPYAATLGAPSGYFSPSNIVPLDDGRWAAFVFAEAAGGQRRGPCLLTTARVDDPAAWRAPGPARGEVRLDGRGPPADRLCSPVTPGPGATVTSLVRHRPTGTWLALIAGRRVAAGERRERTGIWYVTSPDLRRWDPPRLLLETPVMFALDCAEREAVAYPSLIDPAAPGRNFDTVGDTADLWLVRFAVEGCRLSVTRDLLRLPVAAAG